MQKMSRKVRPGSRSRSGHTAVPMNDMKDWRPVFNEFQPDANSEVKLAYMRSVLLRRRSVDDIPDDVVEKLLQLADKDQNGKISYDEFYDMVQHEEFGHVYRPLVLNRLYRTATRLILPKNQQKTLKEIDEYSCTQNPPIFMILISVIEIGVFIYHIVKLHKQGISVGLNGPVPDSRLIYNPKRRFEFWRFVSYMLVHAGYTHVFFNVLMQLFLGVLLELVHQWWRVLIVYMMGVIAGSLATSITDPNVYLAGASGGVYALIAAHLANVVMNWGEMEFPLLRVLVFGVFAALDIGVAVYYRYVGQVTNIGYVAHLAGAIAGLLIGIVVLRNLKSHKWERIIAFISHGIFFVLMLAAIMFNIFHKELGFPDYYPKADKE